MNTAKPKLIRHSDDLTSFTSLGGKAGALARLSSLRLPIPEWFVVPSETLRLESRTNFKIGAELTQTIVTTAQEIAPEAHYFAVRSSALDEDGAEHSFAGQLDSFLFVPLAQLGTKVEAVWRSGYSERILAYRKERGIMGDPPPPSVLIQRMVDADAAGVAFSSDPVTGRRSHAIVSAVLGLGTALVSGESDADTFSVDRAGRILTRQIAEKRTAHAIANDTSEGVAPVPVSAERATLPAIDDTLVQQVAALARTTSKHFGQPQDIEWAVSSGRLWLLQSRPITSLANLADPEGELNIWDNANIAESYSGVTTPLTFSFARGIYEAVYREFSRMMGVSEERISENRDLFPRMLGLINGRIYYNLISWYRLLALLPGFTANRGFMEQMMGVKEGMPEEVLSKLSPAGKMAKFRDNLALARSCAGLLRNHFTLPGQISRFYARLNTALQATNPPLEEMRPDQLAAHYRDLERQLLLKWDAPLVNDFFAMIFYGVLRKLTAKWCGDDDGTLQNDLLCGEGGMISAEPAKRVREMSAAIRQNPTAITTLCEGTPKQIERFLESHAAFNALYRAYIEKFGDRCLEELKLESLTLHDEPLTLLRSVGQFARRFAAHELNQEGGTEAKLRAEAERKVRTMLAGKPLKRALFNWVLRHARSRVRDRENLRFERTRLFGRVRKVFVELGKRFHGLGKLDRPRDIFYLTSEESLGFVDGTTATTNLRALATLRQQEFATFKDQAPSDRFNTRGGVYLGNTFKSDIAAVTPTGDSLKGIGCCPGVVRARARVIIDPRNAVIEAGEILVAPRTDPGWIMLFPSAAGLLVEHGSLLSHSAIVAREMGIPAIVSIGGVTGWVQTGEWLEMDGSTGIVRKAAVP